MPGPIGANDFYTTLSGFTGDVTRWVAIADKAGTKEDMARPLQKALGRQLAGLAYMMREETGSNAAFVTLVDGFSLADWHDEYAELCCIALWDDAGALYHATDADFDPTDEIHHAFGALALRLIANAGGSTYTSAVNQAATTHWS